MVSSQERANIQAYLKSRLEHFTQGLQYSADILQTLEQEKKYQQFTDEVNSNLVQKFECLEDFKLITLLSAYDPSLKSGGQTNSAVWDTSGDQMIQCDHTWHQLVFSLCLHLVQLPAEEDEDSE
jgi:hypothetical protein